jgi:selenocysteine-specific elongation factor
MSGPLRHAVIGTAGHVDHGKTTLTFALTGVQTDRLPEEQRRGITIELGFAPWRIADDLLVSIIDAPGHRRLVHNMIAGASGIDVVLLVAAADEGVMPQTREHVAACKLLGVRRAVVAVSKVDRVDPDLAELCGEEARELCAAHGIVAEVVRCSAKSGVGLDELRRAVLSAVTAAAAEARPARRARLGIDRVFTVHGAGTVVTGTLVAGALAVGDAVRVLGAERELAATVRGLHVHGEACARAQAPTRLAINLAGVSQHEVERGMTVTDDPAATATRLLDVWVDALEPLARGTEVSIFVGTDRSTARVQPVEGEELREGLARLRLTAPLLALGGDRFVLRGANVDGPAGAVCGGGVVLDARPPKTVRAHKRAALLDAVRSGDASAAVLALAKERAPESFAKRAFASRFAIDGGDMTAAAGKLAKTELKTIAEGVWVTRAALEALKTDAVEIVAAHHRAQPLAPGLELATLRAELAARADETVAQAALGELTSATKPKLVVEGPVVRLPEFGGAKSGSSEAQTLERAAALIAAAKLDGVSETDLSAAGLDAKLSRAALAALERRGSIVHTGKLWFDAPAVEALAAQIRAHFQKSDVLTIADFKAMTGLARKQAIPLLEHFDRLRLTRRGPDGSDRLRGPSA